MISSCLGLTVYKVYTDILGFLGGVGRGTKYSFERTYRGDYASIIVRDVGKASVGDMMCGTGASWVILTSVAIILCRSVFVGGTLHQPRSFSFNET